MSFSAEAFDVVERTPEEMRKARVFISRLQELENDRYFFLREELYPQNRWMTA